MSERVTVLLVGATGLIGSAVIAGSGRWPDWQLAALARREAAVPPGARLDLLIADPAQWPAAIARMAPEVLVIALGTTIKAVGGDRAAFRAVDHDLALTVARAARAAGTRQVILVSSVGADAGSRNFYLSVKGETEDAIRALGFPRCDILRPGMLLGPRKGAPRPAERVGQIVSPLVDLLLVGRLAIYRSVRDRVLAGATHALSIEPGEGVHVHASDAIRRLGTPPPRA